MPPAVPTSGPGRATALAWLVALSLAAAGTVASLDAVLAARVRAGTDSALRLSVILPYVGVDGSYVLARAFGLAALLFAALAVAAGLHQRSRRLAGRAPAPWTAAAHRQLGLVTVALVAGHLAVPFTSAVPPYGGWATMLVPLAQPRQWGAHVTLLLSAGVVAFWLLVLLGPASLLLGTRRRWWAAVHTFTVVAYGLAVVHAFWLGTDFVEQGPARVAVLAAQVPVTALLARWLALEARCRRPRHVEVGGHEVGGARVGGAREPGSRQAGARGPARAVAPLAALGAAAAVAGSAALAVLAGLGAAGVQVGGFPG